MAVVVKKKKEEHLNGVRYVLVCRSDYEKPTNTRPEVKKTKNPKDPIKRQILGEFSNLGMRVSY